ncbi:MAG: putative molybdenum carrier protein [Parachlamydiales bacterium]|jgi:hypothetical protein
MKQNIPIEAEKSELILRNENGDHAIIPARYRSKVKYLLQHGHHNAVTNLVNTLPVMEDYAEDGTVVPAGQSEQPQQDGEIYFEIEGKIYSYTNLKKKGWPNEELSKHNTYKRARSGAGFVKVSEGRQEKSVEQPLPEWTKGQTKKPAEQPVSEQPVEQQEEKPKEQSITEGNFTYIRNPQTGKVYVKHKDANSFQDLDEKRVSSPNMIPVIDEVEKKFNDQFGIVDPWQQQVNFVLSQNEDVYKTYIGEFDKQIKEKEDQIRKLEISAPKSNAVQISPEGIPMVTEQPGNDEVFKLRSQVNDLKLYKTRLDKSYKQPVELYNIARKTIKDHGEMVQKDYTKDPVQGMNDVYRYRAPILKQYLPPEGQDQFEFVLKLQDIDEQVRKNKEAIQYEKDHPPEASMTGKKSTLQTLEEKRKELSEKRGKIRSEIQAHKSGYIGILDKIIDQKTQQVSSEPDLQKRMELQNEILGYQQLKTTIYKSQEEQVNDLSKQYESELIKFADLIPNVTPREALNFYFQTLVTQQQQLMDDLRLGQSAFRDNMVNLASNFKNNAKLEQLYGPDGVEAKIRTIAPALLLDELPKEYLTGNKVDPDQGWLKRQADKAFSREYPLGNIVLKIEQTYSPHMQAVSQTVSQQAQALNSALTESGIDKYLNNTANKVIQDKADVKHWSSEDIGNMVGPTLGILLPMAIGNVAFAGVKALVPFANMVRGVKLANSVSKANKIVKGAKLLGAEMAEMGAEYKLGGMIFSGNDQIRSEADFQSGAFGAVGSSAVRAIPMPGIVKAVFGKNSGKFMKLLQKKVQTTGKLVPRKSADLIGRGFGEFGEEFNQTTWQLYRDTENKSDFKEQFQQQFGSVDDSFHFFTQTFGMGLIFGMGGHLGQVYTESIKSTRAKVKSATQATAGANFATSFLAKYQAKDIASDPGKYDIETLATAYNVLDSFEKEGNIDTREKTAKKKIETELRSRDVEDIEINAIAKKARLNYTAEILDAAKDSKLAKEVRQQADDVEKNLVNYRRDRTKRVKENLADQNIEELQKTSGTVNDLTKLIDPQHLNVMSSIEKGVPVEKPAMKTAFDGLTQTYRQLHALRNNPARQNTTKQIEDVQSVISQNLNAIVDKYQQVSTMDDKVTLDEMANLSNNIASHIKFTQDARKVKEETNAKSQKSRTKRNGRKSEGVRTDVTEEQLGGESKEETSGNVSEEIPSVPEETSVEETPTDIEQAKQKLADAKKLRNEHNRKISELTSQIEYDEHNLAAQSGQTDAASIAGAKILEERITKAKTEKAELEKTLPDISKEQRSVRQKTIDSAEEQGYVHLPVGSDQLRGAGLKQSRNEKILNTRKNVKEGDVVEISYKERKDFTKEELAYKSSVHPEGYDHLLTAVVNGQSIGGIPYRSETDNAIVKAIKEGLKPRLVITERHGEGVTFEVVTEKTGTQKILEETAKEVASRVEEEPSAYKKKMKGEVDEINKALDHLGQSFKGLFKIKGDQDLNLGIIPNDIRDSIFADLLKIGAEVLIRIPAITGAELIKTIGKLIVDAGYPKRFLMYVDMFADTLLNALGVINDLEKGYNQFRNKFNKFSAEAWYTSSDEKIRALRKVFSGMWSVMLDNGILEPEREIYNLCQDKAFLESFKNENSVYYHIINNIKPVNPELAKVLLDDNVITFEEMVSLKNFYSGLTLMPTFYIHQSSTKFGDKFQILNSNQNDRTHDWSKIIKTTLETLIYGDIKTDNEKALSTLVTDYVGRGNKNSKEAIIRNKYRGDEKQMRAELISLYSEFLSKITGIHENIWRYYFNSSNEKEFMAGKDGKTEGVASIIYYLQEGNIAYTKGGNGTYIKGAIDYFLVTPNIKGVNSNIVKLVNSTMDSQHVALFYNNIKGDRKTSFEQLSDIVISARNVKEKLAHAFYQDNPILKHHEQSGEIQLGKFDGVSNKSTNNNILADDLSDEDYILSQLLLFHTGDKAYRHFIGQFGDKGQIYDIETPKYAEARRTYLELLKKYEGKSDILKLMATEEELKATAEELIAIINGNSSAFGFNATTPINVIRQFARSFVFNYAINKHYSDLIFHGRIEQYKDMNLMVKRAGSSNSPGYVPDMYIDGGIGLNQKHAILNNPVSTKIQEKLGLKKPFETMDGIQFMTRDFADKMEISMGSIFARVEEFSKLNSVKSLYSIVKNNGDRGLTKTNLVIIDEIADATPGKIFEKIHKMMIDSGAETLSFIDSGTKFADGPVNNVFKDDEFIGIEGKLQVFDRPNSNFFIQQDLRHDIIPEFKKQSIQTIGNFINLTNAEQITELWNKIQEQVVTKVTAEMDGMTDQGLRDMLLEEVDQEQLPELYDYVKKGGNVRKPNPYFESLLNGIKASYIGRKALERRVNRVALQEIPVGDVPLRPPRKTADGKHVLLAEIACNIKGVRYMSDSPSFTKLEDAITYIRQNKLVDLMSENQDGIQIVNAWEIEQENGLYYIPGEPVMVTRVPADDLHSHTLARARMKLRDAGNVIMTDSESQSIAGSDNDGDMRYCESFVKAKDGHIVINDTSVTGMLNQSMMLVLDEYRNVRNFDRIREQISKDKYDAIIKKAQDKASLYKHNNFIDNVNTRKQNVVGGKVISITAKLNTTYDFIKRLNITLKKTSVFGKVKITGFSTDKFSLLKHHIGNLLNLALDNAKDPKIEFLGFNEITAGMFVTALVSDKSMDEMSKTQQETAIIERIKQISEYFNSGIGQEFIRLERTRKRSDSQKTIKDTWKALQHQFGKDSVNELKNLYYLNKDVNQLTTFIDISREIPPSAEEFAKVDEAYNRIKDNDLKNIDVGNAFPGGNISVFLKGAQVSYEQAAKLVYSEATQWSPFFKKVMNEVFLTEQVSEEQDALDVSGTQSHGKNIRQDEYVSAFYKFFNKLYSILAMDNGRTVKQLYNDVVKAIEGDITNNKFLALLQVRIDTKENTSRIEILSNYKKSDISKEDLERIHEDFNALPLTVKQSVVLYSMHEYGITVSSWGGNYSKLFPVEFMIEMDKIMEPLRDLIVTDSSADQNRYGNIFKFELKKLFGKTKWDWNRYPFDVNLKRKIAEDLLVKIQNAQKEKMSNTDIMKIVNETVNIPGRPEVREAYNELVKMAGEKDFVEFLTDIVNRGTPGETKNKPEVIRPKKIISGGQIGGDRGGLQGAKDLGIETGGWIPKGFKTSEGNKPELGTEYGLKETEGTDYPERTMKNVDDSGGTIAILWGQSVGTGKTIGYAQTHNWQYGNNKSSDVGYKPVLVITTHNIEDAAQQLKDFVKRNSIEVLNIAGHRETSQPGIQEFTRQVIIKAFGEQPKQMMEIWPSVQSVRDEFKLDRWVTIDDKPKKIKRVFPNDQRLSNLVDAINVKYPYMDAYAVQMADGFKIEIIEDFNKPRQHSSISPLGELYANADPELQDYIVSHFAKLFPGVKIFSSRTDFDKFVIDSFGSLSDVSLNTIGMTFRGAVWIDPERAVQSTFFHEHAHIYWAMLPNSNPIKKKLLEMFGTEEDAVIAIGQAGTEYAQVMKDGSNWEKFQELLKQFWIEVKNAFGQVDRGDVAMIMAKNIWHNKDGVIPVSESLNAIRFMKDETTGIDFDEEKHRYIASDGKTILVSVTQLEGSLHQVLFDPGMQVNYSVQKEIKERAEKNLPAWSAEDVEKRKTDLMNKWARSPEIGNAIHASLQALRAGQPVPKEYSRMFAKGVLEDFTKTTEEQFKILNPNGDPELAEQLIASEEDFIAGHVDKQIVSEDGITVIDFKTSDKRVWNEDGETLSDDYTHAINVRRYISPFENIKDNKQNHHKIQVNLYGRILAKMGKKVKQGIIQPVYYELDKNGKISKVEFEKPIDTNYAKHTDATDRIIMKNRIMQNDIQNGYEHDEDVRYEGYSDVALDNQRTAMAELQSSLNVMSGETLANISEDSASRILGKGHFLIKEHLVELGFSEQEVAKMDLFTALSHFVNEEGRPGDIGPGYKKAALKDDPAMKILEEIKTLERLASFEYEDIKKYESQSRDYNSPLGILIHNYMIKQLFKHAMLTEIRRENRPGNHGYKLATVLLYEFTKGTAVTQDLYKSNPLMRLVMTDRFMPDNFKPVQLMQNMIREKGDEVDRLTMKMVDEMIHLSKKVDIKKLVTWGYKNIPYLMLPDVAEKKFGIGSREARYVHAVYDFYAKYHPLHKQIANDPNPQNRGNVPLITMPMANMTKTQALWHGGFHNLKLRKLLKPEPWDRQYIDINTDEESPPKMVTFVDYKRDYDIKTGNIKELETYYNAAKNSFQAQSSSQQEFSRKRIIVKHDSKDHYVKMRNHHDNAVMMSHMSSMIKKSLMEDVIPFYDYIDSELYGRGTEGRPGNPELKHIRKYIKKFVDMRLYGKPDDIGFFDQAANQLMTLTALKSLSFNLVAQTMNFFVGQTGAAIRMGLPKYIKGVAWMTQHYWSTRRIMHDLKIVDVTQEHGLEYWSSLWRKVIGFSFIFTDLVETFNHGIILAGTLERKQLNALRRTDLNEYTPMNPQFKRIVEDKIREITGDYGEKNIAIGAHNTWNRFFFQFRRWIPAYVLTQFGSGYIDRNGVFKRGYIKSGITTMNVFVYNYLISKGKKQQIDKDYEHITGKKFPSKYNEMSDRDLLVMGKLYYRYAKEGHIKFSDMDPTERANFKTFYRQVGLLAMTAALMWGPFFGKGDDDDEDKAPLGINPVVWKFFSQMILQRLTGDVLFYFSASNWKYWMETPVAAFKYALDVCNAAYLTSLWMAGEFGNDDAYMKARYQSNEPPYGMESEVKAWNKLLKVTPGGSMWYNVKKTITTIEEVQGKKQKDLPEWMKEEKPELPERYLELEKEKKKSKNSSTLVPGKPVYRTPGQK